MFSEHLQQYAEEKYQFHLPLLGERREEVERGMEACTADERVLMKFLYGTMPLRDAGEYGFDVFLGFVKHSLMVYRTMEWCREIPEDMFLHHILYYRINSENIEDCRRFFYDRLIERIQGLTAREAVLEINYWCAENGTYESSDNRTVSPMTVYRSGKGRCGEESTFAVTAFRSVGIPARQVYTPRWAHCDDNHAWVEVYVDGAWHFLGACEPEEILDKGWFTNASSRALLVHTCTFSDFTNQADAECLGRDDLMVYYNGTGTYARNKLYEIFVVDEAGNPVSGAQVSVEILNMAEYYSVAELWTDANGRVSITIGLGDVHVHVEKDERCLETVVSVKDTDRAVLVLEENDRLRDTWVDVDLEAPADYPMHPAKLTREQKEKNRSRIKAANQMRENRIAGYYQEALAGKYPEEKEILSAAAGNFDEIYAFLSKDENPDRRALLHSLTVKDYKDAKAEILESHLTGAACYRKEWEEKGRLDLFVEDILCPRILFEEMTDYRGYIQAYFTEEEKAAFRRNPMMIWEYVKTHIHFYPELDYQTIFATPAGALRLQHGSPLSKKLLFVGICRTLGIPARMNPVNLEAEAYVDGEFVTAGERSGGSSVGSDDGGSGGSRIQPEKGRVLLRAEDGSQWNYYQTWTIGRQKGNRFVTLDYTGIRFSDAAASRTLELNLEPGTYRLITTSRLPSGNQQASRYVFDLGPGEEKEVRMRLRTGKLEDMLVANMLEDFEVLAASGSEGGREVVSARSLLEGSANILAFLAEGQEPTEHVLNEMLEQQEILNQLDARIWFILHGEDALENRTLKKVLDAIPSIRVVYGRMDEIVEPLARRMYVDPDKLPLLIVTNPGMKAVYGCSGYNVGSVDLMVKLLKL
ncbi:MAG: transglutaminase domain-containing protein [Lachnospiraceae bacterium]|nr:transglutaminase domain-containing protein [Lachnospiraceae bacterium]